MQELLFSFDEVIALARTTDPQTSHDAAKTVRVTDGQMSVYLEFRMYGPMTDEQLIRALSVRAESCLDARLSDSGARSRRSELVRLGMLKDSGRRGVTVSGRQTIIWCVNA